MRRSDRHVRSFRQVQHRDRHRAPPGGRLRSDAREGPQGTSQAERRGPSVGPERRSGADGARPLPATKKVRLEGSDDGRRLLSACRSASGGRVGFPLSHDLFQGGSATKRSLSWGGAGTHVRRGGLATGAMGAVWASRAT